MKTSNGLNRMQNSYGDPPKQRINIHKDLCFCKSGKIIAECCFAQINTTPPAPKTGYSHPKCYARSLGDCSSKISREHLISASVLKIFPSKGVTISGTHWLDNNQSQYIAIDGLASNILCQRHNTSLSGLDHIAQKFFQVILGRSSNQWAAIVRGTEIERWMLKTLCGMAFSGNLRVDGVPLLPEEPHPIFLQTLFYRRAIPQGFGLALVLEEVDRASWNRIIWRPLFHRATGLLGCELYFAFMRVMFFIQGPVPNLQFVKGQSNGVIYHPSCIIIKHGDTHREVHLGWPENAEFVVELEDIPFSAE